jgi:VIT1/CCC1 family predicted Fe2+/Mn2+ transporter
MATREDWKRYRENWQDEVDSAVLYHAMAEGEPDQRLASIYRDLATAEERHAAFWEGQLRTAGAKVPARRPTWRARTLVKLAKRFGPSAVLPSVARGEQANQTIYDHQPETEGTSLRADERSHARLLRQLSGPKARGGMEGGTLARLEGRHRAVGGNALRAAVLGANDGLVSNLSLVMGVAGAALQGNVILVTGLAGLLAGACSMALGEWISVQSSRELAERQLRVEGEELEAQPEEEAEELRLIYQAKGLPEDQARAVADRIMADPDAALDVMAREELGIDPEELGGSAWEAAITSFLLFAFGAAIPVLPFAILSGVAAVVTSVVGSGVGLFAIGAAITLFTGRTVWYSGVRQLLFGLTAAVVTYGVGALIGVSIAG